MMANGPGAGLVEKAMRDRMQVSGIISTGFCGALDPALGIGDIVVDGDGVIASPSTVRAWRKFCRRIGSR